MAANSDVESVETGNWLSALFGGMSPAPETAEHRAPTARRGQNAGAADGGYGGGGGAGPAQNFGTPQLQPYIAGGGSRKPLAPRASPQPLRPGTASARGAASATAKAAGSPMMRRSASTSAGTTPATARGFGMSTPRFGDPRFDAEARALMQQKQYEPRQQYGGGGGAGGAGGRDGGGEASEHSVARTRGLHAAYAQCAALRRMLTALRVNRLLVRWRVATVYISANEELGKAHSARLAMEEAVVEVHKRGEASAESASIAATQKALLEKMLTSDAVTGRLQRALNAWRLTASRIAAEDAVTWHEEREEAERHARGQVEAQLKEKLAELVSTKKLVQKPTQLEAALRERDDELRKAQDQLAESEKKLRFSEQKATKAEDRSKVLQREVQAARKQAASAQQQQSGSSHAGGVAPSPAPLSARGYGSPGPRRPMSPRGGPHPHHSSSSSAHLSNEAAYDLDYVKQQLAKAVAEKHRLEGQLDGQRAQVQTLTEARRRSAAARLTGLMLLKAHQALGPAIRKWQMASLQNAAEIMREDDVGLHGGVVADIQSVGEARQSRILSLQRELLEREAALGAAHTASLKWREERMRLNQELTEARAEVASLTSKVADTALAAAASAEREGRRALDEKIEELLSLKKKFHEADAGWRETAEALHENEALLATANEEAERLRLERNEAKKEAAAVAGKLEEVEDAYNSERTSAADRISELEAFIEKQNQQAVTAKANRPITVQKELDSAMKEATDLKGQLAEAKKKLIVQSKRALDAETRMESLQKEVQKHRERADGKLSRALQQPSPRAGSPLIGMGAFGLPSPRGGATSDDAGAPPPPPVMVQPSPRGGFGMDSPRNRRAPPPRHPGPRQ